MKQWLSRFKAVDGLLLVGLLLVVIGIGVAVRDKLPATTVSVVRSGVTSPTSGVNIGAVHIEVAGAVEKAGVYVLPSGSRVAEALLQAGGLAINADREWVAVNVNQAEQLRDGQKIYIPRTGETSQKVESPKSKVKGGQIVSLNNATLEELDTLPGIGPAMAQRIIDYREANGGFKNIEEVKLVSGIGDKLFEKIKEKISL